MSKLTKRITAMLLSGMLAIGSASGSVYAVEAEMDPGRTSEIAEEVFTEEPVETAEAPTESAQTSEVAEEVFPEEESAVTAEVPVAPDQVSEEAPLEEAVTAYTVTLDGNGGFFVNEWDDSIGDYVEQAEVVVKQIPVGGTVAAVPVYEVPDGQNLIFAGWSLERDGETITTGDEGYAPAENCVLYAVWRAGENTAEPVEDTREEIEETVDEYAALTDAVQENDVAEGSDKESVEPEAVVEGFSEEGAASDSRAVSETENEQEIVFDQDSVNDSSAAVYSYSEPTEHIDTNDVITEGQDDLFADYVDHVFFGTNEVPSAPSKKIKKAPSNLSGYNTIVYSKLKDYIVAVAAGERTTTEFELTLDDLGLAGQTWTAEDLGIESIIVNGEIGKDAVDALLSDINIDAKLVVNHLLSDLPFDLYWYDKTVGVETTGFEMTASNDGSGWVLYLTNGMTFRFAIASEYALSPYIVDASVGASVWSAKQNADAIVSNYANFTDYEKLVGYKEEICTDVSYNYAAAEGDINFGNPWQMIWVFDEDPDTNVVCEGYSKAFQYLCDQTSFTHNMISCITVTGMMSDSTGEEPHMWNIVRMDDGYNYLADVTNSDTGTAGESGELFLVPFKSGNYQGGYTFGCKGDIDLHYAYSEDSLSVYTSDDLTITSNQYGTNPVVELLEITQQPGDVVAEPGDSVSLNIRVNKEDAVYQWQWRSDGTEWENCDFTGYNSGTLSFIMEDEINGKYFRCLVVSEGVTVISDEAAVFLNTIASGVWGTCNWEISGQGILTIHAGTGDDVWSSPWEPYVTRITEIIATENIVLPSNSHGLFAIYWVENYEPCSRCTKMDLSGLDTSNVTDMSWMFFGDKCLQNLDLSGFDTSNVTKMDYMFYDCNDVNGKYFSRKNGIYFP